MYPIARLIRKITALALSCLLLSLSTPSMAITEEEAVKELNTLVTAKQYKQAYDLANEYVMDFGGEPRFDYLMGLAAYHLNLFEESVFAFERAVIVKPKWASARFELAKAYYKADNQAASKAELVKLKNESKDPEFTKKLDVYIDRVNDSMMSKRRQFKQILSITGGWDSNVNSGTSEEFVFISQLGTSIPLSAESKEKQDSVLNLSYMATYQEPFSQKSLLIGSIGLFKVDYGDTPTFERSMADLGLRWQDEMGDFIYQVGMFYRPMLLDSTHYRDQYGYFTNWTLPIDVNWSARFDVGFGKVDSQISPELDVRDVYAAASASYRTGKWQHNFTANHTDIRSVLPSTKHNSYHFYKLDYKANYILTQRQMLSFDLQWQKYNYDVVHPVFGSVRNEDFVMTGVGWRYLYNDWIMLQANYRYSDKSSNVSIYGYERNEFVLGVAAQF